VGGRWGREEAPASVAEAEIEGRRVTLMKPLDYMNLSGEPVSEWARAHSIERTDVLVYLDDVALPWDASVCATGNRRWHNGLLGASVARRNRRSQGQIGIRPGLESRRTSPRVRSSRISCCPFTAEERPLVDDVLGWSRPPA
jgi:PTH1 family peptidyl-tRNA hydrolase